MACDETELGKYHVQVVRNNRAWRPAVALMLATLAALVISACSSVSTDGAGRLSDVREKYPTPMDLATARADCLNDSGWGVKVNEKAEIEASYPSDRQADYELDNKACLVELGIDPDAPTPERVVEDAYEIYVKGANCLVAAGWPISKAPSSQTFKDTYETSPWYPWAEVPPQDMTAALKECPGPEPTY